MIYFETAISFFIGIGMLVLLAFVFSIKSKGIFRLILNTFAGAIVLILLNVFKVVMLPINPLNALLIGFFGVPGIALIWAISVFL